MSALRERYATLTKRDDRAAHAEELSPDWPRSLGRRTEARGWSLIHPAPGGTRGARPGGRRCRHRRHPAGSLAARSRAICRTSNDARAPAGAGRTCRTNDRGPAPARSSPTWRNPPACLLPRQRPYPQEPAADRGHVRWRRADRLRRRRLARCLRRPGRGVPAAWHVLPGRGSSTRAGSPCHGSVRVPNGDRLFRNLGNGRFEDVSRRSGIAGFPGGYGHGVAVGDYDNDGRPDLFVTRWRSYALYRNRGDGTFEDVTAAAGLGGDRDWPTSSAFADLDNDGDLDLYVCHYLRYDPANPKRCEHPESPSRTHLQPARFPVAARSRLSQRRRSVRGRDRAGRHRRPEWARAGSRRGRPRRRRPGQPLSWPMT